MSPERGRRTVESVRRRLGHDKVSQRRACKALGQPRSSQRYQAKQPDMDRRLIAEMRRLSESYPRYGSPRVHELRVLQKRRQPGRNIGIGGGADQV